MKQKASMIGAAIGFGLGGPIGAGIGVLVGQTIFNTDALEDFSGEIKKLAKQYAETNGGELTESNWESLYSIQREAHKKAVEKYGKEDTVFTKDLVKKLVEEALSEE